MNEKMPLRKKVWYVVSISCVVLAVSWGILNGAYG